MGTKVRRDDANGGNMRRFKFLMILYYTCIIIGITLFISVLTINQTDDVLKTKVGELTSALNVQMKMNIDSYLSRVETTATLIFAEEEIYEYSAVDESNDEYEALNTEASISDRLYSLCLMENFVDFGIVYTNNHTVGKISNGTASLFGDRLYEDLAAMINRQRTHDGWLTGYGGNFNRIYYVKRVNDTAVFVTSFYATELESVFEHPGGIADMTVRLIEGSGVMIYSSADGETGTPLPAQISERIGEQVSMTLLDDAYLITVNTCGDNWRVICSVPTDIILKEKNEIQLYILAIGAIAAVIAIVLSVILSFGISSSVDTMVDTLDRKAHIDLLTGILNKKSFEERAEVALRYAVDRDRYAMLLLDIDNFKGVNDTLGHMYGDQVLTGVGDILRRIFRADDCLGRIGGDEFCVLMNITGAAEDDGVAIIRQKCEELCEAFHNNYTGDDGSYKISASIGIALFPQHGDTFETLYRCADKALYSSKHKGKDTYTIYTEELG